MSSHCCVTHTWAGVQVTGAARSDMVMPRVESVEEVDAFPVNSWGIPEVPEPDATTRASCLDPANAVQVVVVPGMAFDRGCHRLGHGKGYYGVWVWVCNTVHSHAFSSRRLGVGGRTLYTAISRLRTPHDLTYLCNADQVSPGGGVKAVNVTHTEYDLPFIRTTHSGSL